VNIFWNSFSYCLKYDELRLSCIDYQSLRLAFLGIIEAGILKRGICCYQCGIISKLECIGNTFLREFSNLDIEEKGTEAGSLWESSGE